MHIVVNHQYKAVLIDLDNLRGVEELSVRNIVDMSLLISQLWEFVEKSMGKI